MTTFTACLIGEDHTEFAIEVEASNLDDAYAQVELRYPEAHVDEIFDRQQREAMIYDRAQSMYDDPYSFDNYDWC